MYTRNNRKKSRHQKKRNTQGKYRGGDWKDKYDEMTDFLGKNVDQIGKNLSEWYTSQAWLNWMDIVFSTISYQWEGWMKEIVMSFWDPIKELFVDYFTNKDSIWRTIMPMLGIFGLIDWAGSAGLFGSNLEANLFDAMNNNYLNLGAVIKGICGIFGMLFNILGWMTYGVIHIIASNGLFLSSFWIIMSITVFMPLVFGAWDWATPNVETRYKKATERTIVAKTAWEKVVKELGNPSKKRTHDELVHLAKTAKEEYNKAIKEESEAKHAWEKSQKYIEKLRADIVDAKKDVEIAQTAIDNQEGKSEPNKTTRLDEMLTKAQNKLHELEELLSEYNERMNPPQINVTGVLPENEHIAINRQYSTVSLSSVSSKESNTSAKSTASSVKSFFNSISNRIRGKKTSGGGGKTQRKMPTEPIDLESVIERLLNKKAIEKMNKTPKSVIDEMRAVNPFPFEIAILCGFIKETTDGYEFVAERINKLKEPIVESLSIINTRCKGADCAEAKKGKRRTLREHPIRSDEIESLGDALTAVKLVHTASIHALTREAVETNKTEMKGGAKREGAKREGAKRLQKVTPASIAKTMSHLKHVDIGWLEKTYPEDFKIANKLGIVKQGTFTEVTNNILSDSAELAQRKISSIAQ